MSAERISESYQSFAQCLAQAMKNATHKRYRARRTQTKACVFHVSDEKLSQFSSFRRLSNPYDTRENRFVTYLLCSLQKQLEDLKETPAFQENQELRSLQETMPSYPQLSGLPEEVPASISVQELPEEYRKLYHAYVNVKYALCEWEADLKNGLPLVNWSEKDVLVGSFGSEKQFKHNFSKKYYYAPERYFDPTCFPIRYVAMYQSLHFAEQGVRYYGEVKSIQRVQRKKIRFAVQRKNGEEWYYVFRVKRWKKLPYPIEIKDEGVFVPKMTNQFLLFRATQTYELFHVGSEQEYRILQQLRRILSYPSEQREEKECYAIEGGKSVRVGKECFEILDEQGKAMCTVSVLEFFQHPMTYLEDIFACVARLPQENDAPLWLKRENEAYFERYGMPYSDD